jgi:hypothetical protein
MFSNYLENPGKRRASTPYSYSKLYKDSGIRKVRLLKTAPKILIIAARRFSVTSAAAPASS